MKAVFVDGASLGWMREPLGIGKYNLSGLYKVLTENIGSASPLHKRPIYTVNPDGMKTVGKNLRTIGFEPVLSEYQDHDDQIIKNAIQATDADEIILVSADQDFVERVREKAQSGVKVYWVATDLPSRDGRSMMGSMLHDFIQNTENVEFVELAHLKKELMLAPWEVRERKPRGEEETKTRTKEMKFVKITLSTSAPHDEIADVLRAVISVIAKFPSIKYTIEG